MVIFVTKLIICFFKAVKFLPDFSFNGIPFMPLLDFLHFQESTANVSLKMHPAIFGAFFTVETVVNLIDEFFSFYCL